MDSRRVSATGSPGARYAQGVAAGQWQADQAQQPALAALDRLQANLLAPRPWCRRLLAHFSPPPAARGLYLWGAVGRGKTLLMDLFAASLPTTLARRLHFHHFMLEVQAGLRAQGEVRDPLPRVAAGIAAQTRVLCLDEFMVKDIGDAMLLHGLLAALFQLGVTLVTTSNTPPQNLYSDGLQRQRFLPAIALLETHCEVLELASPHDWRLRALERARVYLSPDNAHAERALEQLFAELSQGQTRVGGELAINGRLFQARRNAPHAAWFEFAALCEVASASADYIELARRYPALLISHLPQFSPQNEDAAQRFVHLIDELYDRRVKLAVSAQVPAVELYDGTRLRQEFARTESRLIEMQSREYLAAAHRPL